MCWSFNGFVIRQNSSEPLLISPWTSSRFPSIRKFWFRFSPVGHEFRIFPAGPYPHRFPFLWTFFYLFLVVFLFFLILWTKTEKNIWQKSRDHMWFDAFWEADVNETLRGRPLPSADPARQNKRFSFCFCSCCIQTNLHLSERFPSGSSLHQSDQKLLVFLCRLRIKCFIKPFWHETGLQK